MGTLVRIIHAIRSDGFAGVETHVARLAAAQHDRGHRVTVIGGNAASMPTAVGRAAVPTIPARTVGQVARALRRLTVGPGSALVHTHMTAAELAAVATVPRSHRIVATRHFGAARGSSPAGRVAAAGIRRRVTAQISVSRYIADHVDGESVVIHPGVSTREELAGADSRHATVLIVQRLEAEKETAVAIRAFARSGLADRGWGLDVVGDGSQRAELEDLAAHLGIERASTFLGRRGDVVARMSTAAILLAPCSIEGLGMTVVEAMAAGIPVVAAEAGGHLETVGPVPGRALHPPGDVGAAAALLGDLAADPLRRTAYGAALQARQREHFTLTAQVAATDLVYESVL